MRLLVSVSDADEARAAIDGGAHIIDAKDPFQGALGAVTPAALDAIVRAVGGARPLSAALGDAGGDAAADAGWALGVEHDALMFPRSALAGGGTGTSRWGRLGRDLAFVKIGFAPGVGRRQAAGLAAAAVDALRATACRVVLAAYADSARDQLSWEAVLDTALQCGAGGVLLDTRDKVGQRLFAVLGPDAVAAWVGAAQAGGLSVALAGSLRLDDLAAVAAVGADVAGVRGAACDGGRTGRVSAARVRALAEAVRVGRAVEIETWAYGPAGRPSAAGRPVGNTGTASWGSGKGGEPK